MIDGWCLNVQKREEAKQEAIKIFTNKTLAEDFMFTLKFE